MNVFEMLSFDFQEFATSQAGIFIISGIVFLLVGIVIFLRSGKKPAKQAESVNEEIKPVEAKPATEEVKVPEVAPVVEPVSETKPVIVKATEDGVNEVPIPTVAETLNIAEEKPAVTFNEEVKPESLDAPVAQAPVVNVAPVVEKPVVESLDAQPVVYGGASPEVTNVAVEEKPREIYGGANPLENTAPIPTATVNAVAQAPVEAPVAPAVQEAPVAPAVEPVVQPVAPVEAPAAPVATPAAPTAPVIEPPKEEIEKLEF